MAIDLISQLLEQTSGGPPTPSWFNGFPSKQTAVRRPIDVVFLAQMLQQAQQSPIAAPGMPIDQIIDTPQIATDSVPTNALLAATYNPMEEVNRILAEESVRPPNAITGSTRRFVDVPAVLAANAAKWERARPQVVPQGPVIYQPPALSPLFESIKEAQTGSSQVAGYDPNNPPNPHTLTQDQVRNLSPLMFEQYKAVTLARKEKIDAARDAYERMFDLGQRATVNEHLNESAVKLRDGADSATAAKSEYDTADANKKAADAAYQKALDDKTKWEKDLASALASKKVMLRPDGTINPGFNSEAELNAANIRRAEQLNLSRIDNTAAIQRAKMAKDEADIDFDEKRKTATKRKVSTTTKAASTGMSKAQRANQLATQRPNLSRDQIIAIVNAEFK